MFMKNEGPTLTTALFRLHYQQLNGPGNCQIRRCEHCDLFVGGCQARRSTPWITLNNGLSRSEPSWTVASHCVPHGLPRCPRPPLRIAPGPCLRSKSLTESIADLASSCFASRIDAPVIELSSLAYRGFENCPFLIATRNHGGQSHHHFVFQSGTAKAPMPATRRP